MHQVRRVVATPLGTQTARVWVDGRRRANLVVLRMRTRSGRGEHGRVEEMWV